MSSPRQTANLGLIIKDLQHRVGGLQRDQTNAPVVLGQPQLAGTGVTGLVLPTNQLTAIINVPFTLTGLASSLTPVWAINVPALGTGVVAHLRVETDGAWAAQLAVAQYTSGSAGSVSPASGSGSAGALTPGAASDAVTYYSNSGSIAACTLSLQFQLTSGTYARVYTTALSKY